MMTLEQAIQHCKEVAIEYEAKGECYECGKEHRQLAEWLEDYKRLQSVSSWIPCNDRLPDNAYDEGAFCPRYLIMTKYGVSEGWYNPNYGVWFALIWFYTTRYLESEISMERGTEPQVHALGKDYVTHWMPIPEKPEGE